MERERRSRDYWREQLSEYWDGAHLSFYVRFCQVVLWYF